MVKGCFIGAVECLVRWTVENEMPIRVISAIYFSVISLLWIGKVFLL